MTDDAMARRLREARQIAGYKSSADAARALGMTYPTYASYDNGTRSISRVAPKLAIARFFRGSLTWLLTGVGKPRGPSLEHEFLSLDATEQQQIIDLIAFFQWRKRK